MPPIWLLQVQIKRFHYDPTLESGARLSGLINEAVRQDKARNTDADDASDEPASDNDPS